VLGALCSLCHVQRSPELEAVFRRFSDSLVSGDRETVESLIAPRSRPRLITAIGEWWSGHDEIVELALIRTTDTGVVRWEYSQLEGFESGGVGWVAAETVGHRVSVEPFVLRQTAVLELEAGTWRIVQWHVSRESPPIEVFGLDLSESLSGFVSHLTEEDHSAELMSTSDTVTVMFTDIVDSTLISEEIGDEQWRTIVADHFSLLSRIVETQGGELVKKLGDGTMTVFKSARAAIDAAVEIQRALAESVVKVRIGIHTGDSLRQDGDYYGVAVNKAARIAGIAEGGEIVVSSVSVELSGGHGLRFGKAISVSLKGLTGTHTVFRVDYS